MSTQALKLELIGWLTKLNDKKILDSLASLKDSFSSGDWYNDLSAAQKKSIQKGVEEHRQGKYLTSRQRRARYEKKA
jgi:hypothetical protein